MECEQIARTGSPATHAEELRQLIPAAATVSETVAEIIAQVRGHGDAAVVDYTRRFDTKGADPKPLTVAEPDLDRARRALDPAITAGIRAAIDNVRRVAEAGLNEDRSVDLGGHHVTVREAPVERAAVYVPGGRAPYPSTVVMGVVTARVAGVNEIAVCAPPDETGDVNPVVLGACALTGATTVYRMGGAHAIAALAHGTETVRRVDVIVGPGNLYVQEAKRQVSGHVGIDGFAGPSDLVAIADPGTAPEPLTLDLLAQAEHGPGTLVVAISTSTDLLDALQNALEQAPDTGAVARLVKVDDPEQAFQLAQAIAPEHLQLLGAEAEALAPRITHAGSVFVGETAATAFGDYIAGSNHVLPTGGAARFASALNPAHFRRRYTEVRVSNGAAAELAHLAAPVARAEGFELHARSMEARIRDNERG
jgi:histidinol dehydrogenase